MLCRSDEELDNLGKAAGEQAATIWLTSAEFGDGAAVGSLWRTVSRAATRVPIEGRVVATPGGVGSWERP